VLPWFKKPRTRSVGRPLHGTGGPQNVADPRWVPPSRSRSGRRRAGRAPPPRRLQRRSAGRRLALRPQPEERGETQRRRRLPAPRPPPEEPDRREQRARDPGPSP
jgi:hypothetical protein